MKIAILGPVLWDSIWGHGQELTRILSKKHEIEYIEPIVHSSELRLSFQRTSNNPVPKNVSIIRRHTSLGLGPFYGIYTEIKNLLELYRQNCDIFITYYTTCALLATIFSRLMGKKVILIYADDLSELYEPKLAKILTKYFFTPLVASFSNSIVATAQKLKESIEKYNNKVKYVPNGVNLSFFKTKNSFKDSKFTICFVGAFGDWIDFNVIINTANEFKNDENVKFLLVGDGENFKVIQRKINEFNLNNIELTGAIPHSQIPEILSKVDICIIPFKVTPLTDRVSPVKLFEYWAMGKPVISTSFYEIKKIANDKVIFADTPEEFKTAIMYLKNDKELREKYEEIGFQEVKKYDWNLLGEKYLELIESLR